MGIDYGMGVRQCIIANPTSSGGIHGNLRWRETTSSQIVQCTVLNSTAPSTYVKAGLSKGNLYWGEGAASEAS